MEQRMMDEEDTLERLKLEADTDSGVWGNTR